MTISDIAPVTNGLALKILVEVERPGHWLDPRPELGVSLTLARNPKADRVVIIEYLDAMHS
ncbi:hypothetical protein BH10PSE17_BH10PSE17_26780 [soil metagenome]